MLVRFGAFGVEPSRQMVTANWCSAIFRNIDALLARHVAGKLRRSVAPRVVTTRRKSVNQPAFRMPRKWAWLVRTGKHHAAVYGSQLQHVLRQPEMAALLEESAQARRILRPLCRALAVELPGLASPSRRAARDPDAIKTRRIRRRVAPEPFRIPLPRGVLSAARRAGFGKLR